ncbi:endoplasmic reticulum membrane-associated RNA degradation protein-like isoform X1 [Acipenser ruthenus]|uniref:endoplasmic reticulum membrane-associated RNA degradation protein-like isoform X1 n=3 Tax=Acipenser ruthenus TaxID=7906 RepID=UPI0027417896|nr:endoplasmic reticulum membrane-associated RNA degradation protein-like isoform X1 [Acipenser ruthenus]XP_033860909.2 endoplasmic reticulum membrane-associated RNA degradation protein-like isoform X1 [Acipenser ruthenus]XP_033860910.2 endoplasmic reticulum membrane-associated RNA degradation protein-like isoform X1 [Acipenser ruthenus]XP_033860911.2 endoplasmic reticulum membrane-associated RNA degradation protein-like isoform X1 [Acipenser ruthenus]
MPTASEVSSCLSPDVHYMVCKLGLEEGERTDIGNIVSPTGIVSWDVITACIDFIQTEDCTIDYVKSVRLLGPVCEAVHLNLLSVTPDQFENLYGFWFEWTNNKKLFLESFYLVTSSEITSVALGLMKLTSCLERALGDVHLMRSKECPFLFRDLLLSEELALIFGQSVMAVLCVFLGSPRSLNLRNILWHGFASPQEIPLKYFSMLLLLTAGLGQLLQESIYQTECTLLHRAPFIFTQLDELLVFPDQEGILSVGEDLISKSDFVLEIMLPFWTAGITAFRQKRYADCVILILPQLEASLRWVYTKANNCPDRLLTAESSTLYTTFDQILAKNTNNEEINHIPLMLGDPIMEILWDFLNNQEGPRIRDHLSHGEVDLNVFPRVIANQVLCLSLVLLHKFIGKQHTTTKDNELLGEILNSARCYRSRFHPIGKLRKQVLECTRNLQMWINLPVPPQDQVQDSTRLDSTVESNAGNILVKAIFSSLQSQLPVQCMETVVPEDYFQSGNTWSQVLKEIWNLHISTLYCPRIVIEVVSLLRKITSQCQIVSEKVISSSESRYSQWMKKSLRSRQRLTYLRMLDSIQCISPVMRVILLLVTVETRNAFALCEKDDHEIQQHLKFLKAILQYTENLVTYTNPEKNKWTETINLTEMFLMKMKAFICKQ